MAVTQQSHVEGWTFNWTAGLAHKFNSWLSVAGSLNHMLYNGLKKPYDASKNQAKANLGFSLHSGGFQLDVNSSWSSSAEDAGLFEILSNTSGTLSYNF